MEKFNPNDIQAEELDGIPEDIGQVVWDEGFNSGFQEGYEQALKDMDAMKKIDEDTIGGAI